MAWCVQCFYCYALTNLEDLVVLWCSGNGFTLLPANYRQVFELRKLNVPLDPVLVRVEF